MSRVLLIAADKPLPLCNYQEVRSRSFKAGGHLNTLTMEMGFRIDEHRYYRAGTDEMGYPMKPYQYELSVEEHETDLQNLCGYLAQNFTSGESVQLWNLWVGDPYGIRRPVQHCGTLADFDMETLKQFLQPDTELGQCWLTVTI